MDFVSAIITRVLSFIVRSMQSIRRMFPVSALRGE